MSCVFCKIIARKESAEIIYEDKLCVAFLDKHPQTPGHIQLIPKDHFRWIYEVPYIGELFTTAAIIIRGIIPVLGADHVTLATYGIEITHAHIWIVPQYSKSEIFGEKNKPARHMRSHNLASELRHTLKEVSFNYNDRSKSSTR